MACAVSVGTCWPCHVPVGHMVFLRKVVAVYFEPAKKVMVWHTVPYRPTFNPRLTERV